jgi:predicted glycogen debranching enzyme
VITPRHGKPVEINALYYSALRFMETLAFSFDDVRAGARFGKAARRVHDAFTATFWNHDRGCLYDVVRPEGADGRIRPNQLFAVSLSYPLLSVERQQKVVEVVEKKLLTPYGLRTLAPDDEGYRPTYGGDPVSRDSAYHQGTVWPWLFGPFVSAYFNAFGRSRERVAYIRALFDDIERLLEEGCLQSIGEVFDADPPHRAGGAPAQAWSVAEILRVLKTEL